MSVLRIIFHPLDASMIDFRFTTHVQFISADQADQLALSEVEELLLFCYLWNGASRVVGSNPISEIEHETH